MRLGEKLKNFRVSKSISQQEFADKLELPVDVIIAWEEFAKLPSVNELVKIEQVYGLSVNTLLAEDATVPPQTNPQPAPRPMYTQPQMQQQPMYTQPQMRQQPMYTQPQTQQQPMYTQPQTQQQPMYAQPQMQQQPVYAQPQMQQQPMYAQPQMQQQPMYAQPQMRPQPMYAQPVYAPVYHLHADPKKPEMPGGLKAMSWVTFGLAIAAFVFGLLFTISLNDYYQVYYQMGTGWISMIALIFPQAAVITYIIGKAKGYDVGKRNLVIGIVFTAILLFFALIFSYDPNYSYTPDDNPSLNIALSAFFNK